MILFRIFRFLGVKKSWVLVADNEGNTFWCAKYESIVGRKCFSSSRLPSSFAVSHVLVTRERIAHRKGCPAHFTPPTHARLSLARDALPIATLKWKACSLSCLSQILTFRVLHVSEVWTGRLSKPRIPPSHDAPSRATSKEARERVVSSAWTLGILSHFAVWWTVHLCFVFCHLTKNSSVLKAFCFQDDGRYCSERCWSPRVCWILR